MVNFAARIATTTSAAWTDRDRRGGSGFPPGPLSGDRQIVPDVDAGRSQNRFDAVVQRVQFRNDRVLATFQIGQQISRRLVANVGFRLMQLHGPRSGRGYRPARRDRPNDSRLTLGIDVRSNPF